MLIIPTAPVPVQTFQVPLNGQNCVVSIYQKSGGLFLDLAANGAAIVTGAICENLNLVVRSSYLGFVGDLMWIDNFAASPKLGADPGYLGLGAQFSLAYLFPDEIPAGLGAGVS